MPSIRRLLNLGRTTNNIRESNTSPGTNVSRSTPTPPMMQQGTESSRDHRTAVNQTLIGFDKARELINENKDFLQSNLDVCIQEYKANKGQHTWQTHLNFSTYQVSI